MPIATNNPTQEDKSIFLGLRSYTEANSNAFFGRDNEIDATTTLIQLNSLTIVFGRSGTGKTSLLNAGVFPKLRKNYCLPFRIRLEFNQDSPDLVTQVKNVLKKEIDNYKFNVQTYPGEETLWEYFHKELLWVSITPILVFDQFEEIFTLSKTHPRWANEMPAFWEELSDLIENNIPKKLEYQFLNHRDQITYNYKTQRTKIVFAFREEYLPEFESIASKIPSLKYSRFRLLPMNGNQAYEVITKTWKDKINPAEAKQIVSYFTNDPGNVSFDLVTIEPSLLSQVCAYIDTKRIASGGGKVSTELMNEYPKETILRTIYEEAVTAANEKLSIQEQEKKVPGNRVKKFLEENLITSEGYRNKYNLGGNDETLRPAINELNSRYFLREDDNAVELTHDVVAPIIKTDREKRKKDEAFAKLKKRVAIIAALLLLIGFGALAIFTNESTKAIKAKNNAIDSLRITEAATDLSKKEMRKFDSLLVYKKDSLETAVINKWKNKDSSAAQIARLKNEINRLDSIIKSGYIPENIDSNVAAQLKKLEGQVQVLKNDSIKLADTIADKDARLKEIDIKKIELENELKKEKKKSISIQEELDKKKIELTTLGKANNELSQNNNQLSNLKTELEGRTKKLEQDLALSARQIADLKQQVEAAKKNQLANLNASSTFPGNLRIQVYDKSGEFKTPITKDTFFVYIIPNNVANKDILEKNKNILLTKDCEEFNNLIQNLAGWQKAYYKDGYYYFHDVIQNGKYKIKICNILDGYFNLSMPSPSGEVYWWQNEKQKIAIKLGRF